MPWKVEVCMKILIFNFKKYIELHFRGGKKNYFVIELSCLQGISFIRFGANLKIIGALENDFFTHGKKEIKRVPEEKSGLEQTE